MIVARIFSVVFILISSTVNVNSQTCEVTSPYGSCSSNSGCGCLPIALSNDIGICALVGVSCSQLSPCQLPDNTCEKLDHICVFNSRCNSNPVCYPMALIDQRLCPSLTPSTTISPPTKVISNYSSALTTSDGTFSHPGSLASGYYYKAIQIIVGTTGTYNLTSFSKMDTYGFLYNGAFNPSYPSENLIVKDDDAGGNDQFKLKAFLQAGVIYVLVVSTYEPGWTGSFSVVASGPDNLYFIPINITQTTASAMTTSPFSNTSWSTLTTTTQNFVISNYFGELTNSSETYPEIYNHYQAIQIMVNTTGIYDLSSFSGMDTYGCLYQGTFNRSNANSNRLLCNDDSDGDQFKLTYNLQAGVPYTLIVATLSSDITGPFRVVGSGPDKVYFTPIEFRQTTEEAATSTATATTFSSIITSNYSDELTNSSEKLPGKEIHYQAIQIMVNTRGTYDLSSISEMDTVGCLYQGTFNPSYPSSNELLCNDDSIGTQFKLRYNFEAGVLYTLIVKTYSPGVTGPFTIVGSGPDNVYFTRIDILETTESTVFPTARPTPFTSNYSSALTFNNEKYARAENLSSNYYYESIKIMINTTGIYTFTSVGSLDAYGYLYQSNFNPSYPSSNLITEDDQRGDQNQFKFLVFLDAGVSYTLVYTTYSEDSMGSFSITASGPDNVYFTSLNTPQITSTAFPWFINTTRSISFTSNYSSALTINSGTYVRHENFTSDFYYEAIQLNLNTSGNYTFTSKSNIDTYGYIYQGSFYPSYPSLNIRVQDDDAGLNGQFKLTGLLQANLTYVLVVTTYSENITGIFSILANGPDNVYFIPINTI